jgi:hypothetical protein
MPDKYANQKKDPELRSYVVNFLRAFKAAAAVFEKDVPRIFDTGRFTIFPGGAVELTEDVTANLRSISLRAAKLLGSKAGNEKALRQIALKQAQDFLANNATIDTSTNSFIDKLFEEGSTQFDFLVPNRLILFQEGVRAIRVGRVRAMMTNDFEAELARIPNRKLHVVADKDFSIEFAPLISTVRMHPVCWVVSVDAAEDNVEEEAKWLIDIAVGFLRVHYAIGSARFPRYGMVEPHPIRPKDVQNVGVKFSGTSIFVGGVSVPPAYEVGKTVEAFTMGTAFIEKAGLIFDPPDKSLAERVGQGLGWLTRGRQAEDRAERLLYFFTAIESLLSSDDKSAPVIQNIARHAGVILSENNADRAKIAAEIRRLYTVRSSLVHAGNRGVLWSTADTTQYLAESMFWVVLDKCDLSSQHRKFIDELSQASYGLPWPDTGKAAAPPGTTDGK